MLGALLKRAGIRVRLVAVGLFALTSLTYGVVVPLLVEDDFSGSVGTLAALTSLISAGCIIGSVLSSRRRHFNLRHLSLSMLGYSTAMGGLAATDSVAVASLACIAMGIAAMSTFNGVVVALQAEATSLTRGAVMGIFSSVYLGGQGIAGLLAGLLVSRLGVQSTLFIGSASSALIACALYALRFSDSHTWRSL